MPNATDQSMKADYCWAKYFTGFSTDSNITFFSKMYTGSVISLQIFFLQILINLNFLIRGCLLIISQVPLITGASIISQTLKTG